MPPPDIRQLEKNTQLLVWILDGLQGAIAPGITTRQLDQAIHRQLDRQGAHSLYLGYEGYPACCSLGVNDVVSYATPSDRPLAEGDLLHLQLAVEKDGGCATIERTFPVGRLSRSRHQLWLTAKRSLRDAIGTLRAGAMLTDAAAAIEERAIAERASVVREWLGHGVGQQLAEPPDIPHYRSPRRGPPLKEGAVVQLRPLLTNGKGRLVADEQGWNLRSDDGADLCLMAHTIAIEAEGVHVLSFAPWDCWLDETPERSLALLSDDRRVVPVPIESVGLHQLVDARGRPQFRAVAHVVAPGRPGITPASLAEFTQLLNSGDVALYDIQLFLEKYPDFLPETGNQAMRTTIALPQNTGGEGDDLLIEPLPDSCFDPARYGLPFKPTTVDEMPSGRLDFYLHAVCGQLSRFLPFYDGRKYVDVIREETGIRTGAPAMAAVISRTLALPDFVRRQLDRRLPWVCTTTVDKLHSKARHRLRQR